MSKFVSSSNNNWKEIVYTLSRSKNSFYLNTIFSLISVVDLNDSFLLHIKVQRIQSSIKMFSNLNNNQRKDDTLDRWRNLTLSTHPLPSQEQVQPARPSRYQSQPGPIQQPHLQSGQRQHQSQTIQRLQLHSQPRQQQQQQQQQKPDRQKKNKARGNRKLQRYRAKLRKRGVDAESITNLINNYNKHPNQGENNEEVVIPNINVEDFVPLQRQVGII